MNRILVAMAVSALLAGAAACSDPAPEPDEGLEPTMQEPVTPPPVEEMPPVDATVPPPATDNSTLPTDGRESEETVMPESETLFY